MSTTKICYVISHIDKAMAFEWIAKSLKTKFQLTFILLNPSSSNLEDFLVQQGLEVKRITYRGKQNFLSALIKAFFYFLASKPHVVHAHLFDAQLIGLTAAWLAGVKKRIYTRHNSNYHHVYHPRGVKFDIWSNRMATQIISISQSTDHTLVQLEHVAPSKIVRIPHGFELKAFEASSAESVNKLCKKWHIDQTKPVIGVIARHIEWKGIQFIVPAFRKFLDEYPTATLVLANASGPYHETLVEISKTIPSGNVVLLPFEEDIASLYALFDIYVHTPVDSLAEAFGQTYVEALAAGVPSIFTLSGVAAEFIVHERNALVVKFKNTEEIYQSLMRLWKDEELRMLLSKNGRQDVFSQFGAEPMLDSLSKLYDY